ncbi:MAG: head GIN domain-containing protein [Pseudomonadota bacterium]
MIKQSKRLLATLLTTLLACTLQAAFAAEETREVDSFSRVAFSLPFEVQFVPSSSPYVTLEGDGDVIEDIITEVDGDTLRIKQKERWLDLSSWSDDEVIVTVGFDKLEDITMSGSGDGYAEELSSDHLRLTISGSASLELGECNADEVEVSIAGSGDVEISTLEAGSVRTRVAGSGNIKLEGRAVTQVISIAGSGDHEAPELKTQETKARISGSGDILVWAQAKLDATIMGSGDIEYYGDANVSERVMGSGSITRLGDSP